ncbi:Uma2 family endonuclease [Cyanothece sp. BG0011]|nr:Uma2 family endonuclease [Cyanothece sp. BG0011]
MSATIPFVIPINQISLEPGSQVTITDISWPEFETMLQQLGENHSARLSYSKGILEIMVPLPEHERAKELISDIVKILLKLTKRKYEPFGSTTFKKEGIAGVEPDACFYIKNYQRMISRRRLQPDDPPPDLAIECDLTSKTTLEAYQTIKVPELWIYDSGNLKIYLLQNDKYIHSQMSPTFPNINLTQIIPDAVERSWQVGSFQTLEELESNMKQL